VPLHLVFVFLSLSFLRSVPLCYDNLFRPSHVWLLFPSRHRRNSPFYYPLSVYSPSSHSLSFSISCHWLLLSPPIQLRVRERNTGYCMFARERIVASQGESKRVDYERRFARSMSTFCHAQFQSKIRAFGVCRGMKASSLESCTRSEPMVVRVTGVNDRSYTSKCDPNTRCCTLR
jgi:hypothetical protein